MKQNTVFLLILLIGTFFTLFLVSPVLAFTKTKAQEKDVAIPSCTNAGEIQCPKGFKPNCPEQYKPSCIFVLQKQQPACLADSTDTTFYNYRLDKISCKKGK